MICDIIRSKFFWRPIKTQGRSQWSFEKDTRPKNLILVHFELSLESVKALERAQNNYTQFENIFIVSNSIEFRAKSWPSFYPQLKTLDRLARKPRRQHWWFPVRKFNTGLLLIFLWLSFAEKHLKLWLFWQLVSFSQKDLSDTTKS